MIAVGVAVVMVVDGEEEMIVVAVHKVKEVLVNVLLVEMIVRYRAERLVRLL